MTTKLKEPIELGSIKDKDNKPFTVFCETIYFDPEIENVVCFGITFENETETLYSYSLAGAPDRFPERQITILEEDLLNKKRGEREDYLNNLHTESK